MPLEEEILYPKFKHMLPAERRIWSKFLIRYGDKYRDYNYDVHLGKGLPLDPTWPEYIKRLVKSITTKRVDAIAKRDGIPVIFEVKERAGMSALGQLLAYRKLYKKQYRYKGRVDLVCVCERVAPDLEVVYKAHKVQLVLV